MGQYFKAISLDVKKRVDSWNFRNGAKLMEHSWIGNHFVNFVEQLLAEDGKWFGHRIVWAGDYADPETDSKGNVTKLLSEDGKEYEANLYDIIQDDEVSDKKFKVKKFRYLINLDTKEFVDYNKIPLDNDYTDDKGHVWKYYIHPLPLLTCEGNGRGGGDYHKENPLVGSWARNRITVSTAKPSPDFKRIDFNLTEK